LKFPASATENALFIKTGVSVHGGLNKMDFSFRWNDTQGGRLFYRAKITNEMRFPLHEPAHQTTSFQRKTEIHFGAVLAMRRPRERLQTGFVAGSVSALRYRGI
jgi:hypothetical protein